MDTQKCFQGALLSDLKDTGRRGRESKQHFQSTEIGSHGNREISTLPFNIKDNTKQDPRFLDLNKRETLSQNRPGSGSTAHSKGACCVQSSEGNKDRACADEPGSVTTEPGVRIPLYHTRARSLEGSLHLAKSQSPHL